MEENNKIDSANVNHTEGIRLAEELKKITESLKNMEKINLKFKLWFLIWIIGMLLTLFLVGKGWFSLVYYLLITGLGMYLLYRNTDAVSQEELNNTKLQIILKIQNLSEKGINASTIMRCILFCSALWTGFYDRTKSILHIPFIASGIDGDIDIEFNEGGLHLLISISNTELELSGLYGTRDLKPPLSLDFTETGNIDKIIEWLM